MFEKEKAKIKKILGNDVYDLLKGCEVVVAGGAITSIFTGKDINDWDLYFKSYNHLRVFLANVFNKDHEIKDSEFFADTPAFKLVYVNNTSRSILFVDGQNKLQAIHYAFYAECSDIFKSFDFTLNMGAYDFAKEEFVLHESFMHDNASRRIVFNPDTTYPIISMLRVNKYIERGYSISKKEMFKVALAVNNLKIGTWEQLEDQLSGFYGVDVSKIFDKAKEFSLEAGMSMLDDAQEGGVVKPAFEYTGYHRLMSKIGAYHSAGDSLVFYKKLLKNSNGTYTSPCYTGFIWTVGEQHDGGKEGIRAFPTEGEAKGCYYSGVVVKLEVDKGAKIKYLGDDTVRIFGKVRLLGEIS